MLTHYWKKNQESGEFDPVPVDEVANGWAWKHQQPITIPDIEREQRFPGCVSVLRDHSVRSYTVLPISIRSHHFGALGLGKSFPDILDSEDVEFLSCVALMGALALERDRAHSALEEQQSLVAISRELSSSLRSIARYERTILRVLEEDGKGVRRYGDDLEGEPFCQPRKCDSA
jgi:GAF domain-containing protein